MGLVKSSIQTRTKLTVRKMSTWPTLPPKWSATELTVLLSEDTSSTPNTNLKEIMQKSKDFPIKFPKVTMLCQNLLQSAGVDALEKNIQSVYSVIHEHALFLCAKFLLFKREHGTNIEKDYYKNLSVKQLIERLLNKRAVTFMESCDTYLLLDGNRGYGNWETIGKNCERPPLVFENYLSYDEIKLSALLSVSSYTYFINDGSRSNNAKLAENRSEIADEGIIIGLIGTRLEKEEVMEYQEMVISCRQNIPKKGYGDGKASLHKVFADFYEDECYVYDNKTLTKDTRFFKLDDGMYFDNISYSKRLALSFDTLLLEANFRAKTKNQMAYIHVVGIGLGVWKLSSHQTKIFLETFLQRLNFLGSQLSCVSDVHFAYISGTDCIAYKNGDIFEIEGHPNKGIKIHISRREPHTKLKEEGKLLVVSYAWDGNALPGNEFWIGMMAASGDCAAAASTQIAELHNPHINKLVCADNLMVATLSGNVLPFPEFVQQIKS